MNTSAHKISIVNYTNTLPFKWALKKSDLLQKIDLQEDIPSICAQKLKYGQVEMALVPVALLAELDEYHVLTDYCIGANGKVDSVMLYSQVPLHDIETITLDYQSRSSITLTKILAKEFWKIDPQYIDAKPGFEKQITGANAAVVIGDRTFELNGTHQFEYDLSTEWYKFTGLPFVFAVWASTHQLDRSFVNEFNAVLKYGVDFCFAAINESEKNLSISKDKAIDYLTRKIDYKLDEPKRKAMALFLEKIRSL